MARLWVCKTCGSKERGPDRPRRNASVRYCFPCSSDTGLLVERYCPSLDRQREIKQKRKASRNSRRRAKQDQRFIVDGEDLRDRMAQLVTLRCWRAAFRSKPLPGFTVRWSTAYPHGVSGSARDHEWRICLTIGVEATYAEAEEALIHELAHLAVGCENFHNSLWREMFQQAVFEAWGVLAQGRSSIAMDEHAAKGIASMRKARRAA